MGHSVPEVERSFSDTAAERQKGANLVSILSHYQAEMAKKRLKKGQNRAVTVTDQLTINNCIVFIINILCEVWQAKCG